MEAEEEQPSQEAISRDSHSVILDPCSHRAVTVSSPSCLRRLRSNTNRSPSHFNSRAQRFPRSHNKAIPSNMFNPLLLSRSKCTANLNSSLVVLLPPHVLALPLVPSSRLITLMKSLCPKDHQRSTGCTGVVLWEPL